MQTPVTLSTVRALIDRAARAAARAEDRYTDDRAARALAWPLGVAQPTTDRDLAPLN